MNNQAPRGGAGIANWFSACATVTDCRFLGNVSDGSIFFGGRGGAVQEDIQDTCNSKYINCTFSGNIADVEGGAVWMGTSLAEFVNCTFTSNVAATGGAIFYWQFSSPTLTNCILFNDTPDELATTRTIPPTVTYSNIEGGFTGEGNIDVDPLFVDAAGPDAIVGTEDDNLRLSPGSPCIDAGDNDIVLTLGVGTDIGGLPRRFDDCHTVDTGRGEPPLVDMGPYEFSDDSDDADGDGVCDAEDICPGGDDKIDSDGDGAPDDCDPCPADNPDDTDGDGVCESADICPDSDDTIDSDGDGVPDGCDLCPGGDDSIDTDADSVPDDCDRCPGSDDSIDTDGDGLPDDCDICDNRFPDSCTFTSPIQAPPPHDIHKNRYLSIDHRGEDAVNVGVGYDLRIELSATLVNGVTAVGLHWWAHTPDADCISVVGWSRPATPPNWNACPTVHLTGCPVIPTSTYAISIVVGDLLSVPPFTAETQTKPGVRWHGDAVGFFDSDTNTWTPPQGTVNIDDAVAAIKTFRNPNAASATHVSVTDMEPNLPGTQINRLVNINDVFSIIKGFQGFEYPGPSIQLCPDA